MTCRPWQSRRNLDRWNTRGYAQEVHEEILPLRYRLYCEDGAYNIKCGGASLVAEMRQAKPSRIERLPMKGETADFPKPPGLIFGLLEVGDGKEM